MCSCNQSRSDTPPWPHSLNRYRSRQRDLVRTLMAVAALQAVLIPLAVYVHSPTDIVRAEADLKKASSVVKALNDEAAETLDEAEDHKKRSQFYQACLDEKPNTPDSDWVEWHRSKIYSHKELYRAKRDRRDNLVRLTAGYYRLLAEAECEIIRAKDARDRGTPYKVAPRVREILTPILGAH
jgi:hypothetical protein